MYRELFALEMKATPNSIYKRSDRETGRQGPSGEKVTQGYSPAQPACDEKSEREKRERALKCWCLAKGYVHLFILQESQTVGKGGEGQQNRHSKRELMLVRERQRKKRK